MPPMQSTPDRRKRLGAWYTPDELVALVIGRTITPAWLAGRAGPVRVLDPACGDGRFLRAAAAAIADHGGTAMLTGIDIDVAALDEAARDPALATAELRRGDALAIDWAGRTFDLVVGNPPFLSQMAADTTRGGASRHGGGPYADAAAEFLSLAVELATPAGGRIGLVLPQSILTARDAGGVRRAVDAVVDMSWSWWSPERHFDAEVLVCALGFERAAPEPDRSVEAGITSPTWSHVVVRHLGVPDLPAVRAVGTVGDRAVLNANFRDEYYGLVPAVGDHPDGPPLVTSGLIDPGRCHWGDRPVRFAKRSFAAPRVDVALLDQRMQRWARRKLVPKVLVASQTTVVEAVVDELGEWLPGVPVTSVVPVAGTDPWQIGAVLTSPVATLTAWHLTAGSGLSARSVRLGPSTIGAVPWPAGSLDEAVVALRDHDVEACGREVTAAFGVDLHHPAVAWWLERVSRVSDAPPVAPAPSGGDPSPVSR